MAEQDARKGLDSLTVAECRVLYWRCQGLKCADVARKLFITERTVYFHLTNVYIKLGLEGASSSERQLALGQTYCPLLQERIQDPETDCQKARQSDKEPVPEPDEAVLALVLYDDQMGLVPVGSTGDDGGPKPPTRVKPADIIVLPPKRRVPPVLWVVLGIVVGVVAVLVLRQLPPQGERIVYVTQPPAPTATEQAVPSETATLVQTEGATSGAATGAPSSTMQPTPMESPTVTSVQTETPTPRPTVALPLEDNFDDGPKEIWQPIIGTWP